MFEALAEHLVTRRFVTLRGPGGIGKTTLAVDLAHGVAGQFRDGVRFLDLGSLKEANLVAVAAASALGLLIPVGDPTPRLLNALHDQQILLVLDSCEHVIEAVSRLAEKIYQHAPGVSLLATSRESLDAEGESVFELASLGIPPDNFGSEAELVKYSSTRLFMECAVAAGYSARLSPTPTPRSWPGSVASLMECRWRSNWSQAGFRRMAWSKSTNLSRGDCAWRGAGAAPRRRVINR